MKKKVLRDSNYELLRIISMIFIVIWHIIQHGQLIEHTTDFTNMVLNMVMFFIIVHVNCFMLITGYYQSKSKFNLKKVLSFLLQIWFYNFTIVTILSLYGLIKINYTDYLISILPFNLKPYWYIKCFLIIYMLSPFINSFIEKADRIALKKLIIIMLLCFSILPFFSGNLFYEETGFTINQQLLMYFIGAYIRKYEFDLNILGKLNDTQKKFVYFTLFIACWLTNVMLYYFQLYLSQLDVSICKYIANNILMYRYFYNNPIVIIQSISMFLFFKKLNIKSKLVNIISTSILGVYIIHENEYIKQSIYKWIGIYKGHNIYGNSIIIKVLLYAIIIFISCSIIELIRQFLFHIITKLKISKKIKARFKNMINRICEIH